jgi:hypothetical protein
MSFRLATPTTSTSVRNIGPLVEAVEGLQHARQHARRNQVTIAAVILLGGIVWLALERDAAWAGWGMIGVGVAWLLAVLHR